MFELPEFVTLASQINEILRGKTISRGTLGNSPHRFVWYNRSHVEFESLTERKTIGETTSQGKWLFIQLDPGYVLLFGECGGKIIYHPAGSKLPKKYHLLLSFEDGSFLTATTQLWGAMELYKQGEERKRQYIVDMRPTPTDVEFTSDYFNDLIDEQIAEKKRSVKGLLTQDQLIPGLGNAIAQDIQFKSGLHPKYPIESLSDDQRRILFKAIVSTVQEVIERGGRYDEYDLFNRKGGYVRIMDKNALDRPCPECGGGVEKIQYLGGACYLCPRCQEA